MKFREIKTRFKPVKNKAVFFGVAVLASGLMLFSCQKTTDDNPSTLSPKERAKIHADAKRFADSVSNELKKQRDEKPWNKPMVWIDSADTVMPEPEIEW